MKRFLIPFTVLFILLFTSSSRGFSIRCEHCLEDCRSHKGNPVGIATRQWGESTVERDGHVCGWYRCSYGHHYLVDLGPKE